MRDSAIDALGHLPIPQIALAGLGQSSHTKPKLIADRSEAIALLRCCSHIRWGNGFNPAEDRIACPGTGRSDLLGALATGGMIAMFSGSENTLVGVTRVLNIQANEIGNWSWGGYPIGIPVETVAAFKGLRIRFGEVFDPTLRGAFGNHMHRTGIAPTCAFRPSVH